jgi:hypothetical protein
MDKTIHTETQTKTHMDYLVAIMQVALLEYLYMFGSGILLLGSLLQCADTGRLKQLY